ncbi:MAG: hypothetical protein KC420_09240, partial [Myxococcales bacterium]|nr:hypothetical protein [Myxococcales bacterium]
AAIDAEREALDRSLAELDAERLRRGDEGDLDAQIRALEAAMAPHAANLELFDQEPAWADLFDHDYGTPLYPLKWWMFRYYRHWRQADAVVAALGPRFGVDDFAGLRRRYLEERAAREALARHWEVATARKAGFDNLDRGRRSALAAVAELDARHLARARRILRERLRETSPQALLTRLQGPPTLAAWLRRIAAIEAKGRLLAASFTAWVQQPQRRLRDEFDADERELVALTSGHERAMAWEDFVDTHADPEPAWAARRLAYQDARRRLLAFRAYDDLGAEGGDDELWAAVVGEALPRPRD